MHLIPSIVIFEGIAYHTVQHQIKTYLGDPMNIMKILSDYEVNEIAIVVKDQLSLKTVKLAVPFIQRPVSVTGCTPEILLENNLISFGVDRVGISMNTASKAQFETLHKCLGRSTLIANVNIYSDTDLNVKMHDALVKISKFVSEIIIHDIFRSGSQLGLRRELINFINVLNSDVDIRVSAEGGFDGNSFGLNDFSAIYYSTGYIFTKKQVPKCNILINPL